MSVVRDVETGECRPACVARRAWLPLLQRPAERLSPGEERRKCVRACLEIVVCSTFVVWGVLSYRRQFYDWGWLTRHVDTV